MIFIPVQVLLRASKGGNGWAGHVGRMGEMCWGLSGKPEG